MKSINRDFYEKSYKEYGISAKGVHWYSKETQFLRFKVITKLISNLKSSSVVDIGCGFGDYLEYLNEIKQQPEIYLGLDCEEFMIDICKKRFPNSIFLRCDILKDDIHSGDYLICSGALNIFNKAQFLQAIENCTKASKKGFIFNFLTEKSLHNLSVVEVYDFCKKFTKKVTISDNYLHNDITFFLEK